MYLDAVTGWRKVFGVTCGPWLPDGENKDKGCPVKIEFLINSDYFSIKKFKTAWDKIIYLKPKFNWSSFILYGNPSLG